MDIHQDIHIRRPYVCTLSPESLEKAKRELNEDPDTRQQKIDDLRAKFKKDRPDIKLPPDDAFLIRFLRNKKFDIKRSFKMLEHYYEVRRKYPELFVNYRPSQYKHIYELEAVSILPGRDRDGRKIVMSKIGGFDSNKYDFDAFITAHLMSMEKLLDDEEIQVHGMVELGDWDGVTMKHITRLGMAQIQKQVDVMLNALPMRFKAGHYVRQPHFFETIMALFRPLMTAKMNDRFHFHGNDYGTLHEHIPSSILPSEFGGPHVNFDHQGWYKELMKCDAYFDYMNQFGIPKPSDVVGGTKQGLDAGGGIAGSFKKLNVD